MILCHEVCTLLQGFILVPIHEVHPHWLTAVMCFCTLGLYPCVRFVFLLTLHKFMNVKEVRNTVVSGAVSAHWQL